MQNFGSCVFTPKDLENTRVNGPIMLVANTRLGVQPKPHFKRARRHNRTIKTYVSLGTIMGLIGLFLLLLLLLLLFPGGTGGRYVGLTTLPPSCADCLEIWEPQSPGTLWTCQACNGIALPFIYQFLGGESVSKKFGSSFL